MRVPHLLLIALVAVIILMVLQQKEGFQNVDDALSPEEFGFHLVQAVKGPIKRLSSTLLDIPTWKERFTLATMNPVELARHQLRNQAPQ
jgi:hypothetical protein